MLREFETTGQLTLDGAQDLHIPADDLVRHTDPVTSKAAAAGDRTTHRLRILDAYSKRPAGMDYLTAARLADLPPWEVTRRVSDLLRLGLLEVKRDSDGIEVTVQLPSNRPGRVYLITALGVAALADH